jgi:hypothetical protein
LLILLAELADFMRLLFLISSLNPHDENHIKCIEFLEGEVKLIFYDDIEKRFCFRQVNERSINIYDDISKQLDNVIQVRPEFSDNENNGVMKVQYEELCVFKSTISMESIGNIFCIHFELINY